MNTRRKRHAPLALAVALALGLTSAYAATITVHDGGDSGGTGTCTLRQAITSANSDAQTGNCVVGTSGSDTIDFDGSLAGSTITLAGSPLDISSEITIAGSGQTIDAAGNSSVMTVEPQAVAHLYDLTLTGGSGDYFGGVGVNQSTFTLTDGAIVGNAATLTNTSSPTAGGLAASYSTVALTRSRISGNTATSGVGGMLFVMGKLTVTDSSISDNVGGLAAGGAVIGAATATISGATIRGNRLDTATANGAGGIALLMAQTAQQSVTLLRSTIADNSASGATVDRLAGGFTVYGIPVTTVDCTVAGNTAIGASFIAGAGSVSDSPKYAGRVNAFNTTITGNSATADNGTGVGGILLGIGGSGSFGAGNSVLAGNTGSSDADLYLAPASSASVAASFNHALLGADLVAYTGNGNQFTDNPELRPLADNGGPTHTMAPMPGSPVLDAGNNALVSPQNTTDQRGTGFARVVNGSVDIGAVEATAVDLDRIFYDGFE